MQRDFDVLILASPIIQIFWRQTFFLLFISKTMPEFYIKTTVKESILHGKRKRYTSNDNTILEHKMISVFFFVKKDILFILSTLL